jgi:hypothetical protein
MVFPSVFDAPGLQLGHLRFDVGGKLGYLRKSRPGRLRGSGEGPDWGRKPPPGRATDGPLEGDRGGGVRLLWPGRDRQGARRPGRPAIRRAAQESDLRVEPRHDPGVSSEDVGLDRAVAIGLAGN